MSLTGRKKGLCISYPLERGIPCSDVQLVDWNEKDGIRAFFAEVGGIVFEVLRVEPKKAA